MRLLVVHAHPVPESFSAALFRAVVEAAEGAGHEVRALDLHADGFQPVMGAEERRGYDGGAVPADLAAHVESLRWAEGLLFVHPTWWMGPPAMLKGWLERVWRPGVAFRIEGGRVRPALTALRLLGVVTTLGSSRLVWTLMGQPGRRILLRAPLACTGGAKTLWLALHDMDRSTPARREAFLQKARAKVAAL